MKKTTISFHTIGCRSNQYETAVLRNAFDHRDYCIVPSKKAADIAVINTCTVTENSDTDTRRFVNRLIRLNPDVRIALIGCQAQLQHQSLKTLPHVAWVIGNAQKFQLPQMIKKIHTSTPYIHVKPLTATKSFRINTYGIDAEHTRANLKIQEGCDNFCTYCEVPYARGRARSREFQNIVDEARALVNAGHKEIILTGINIGTYHFAKKTLLDVVKALDDISPLKRIRISSIEPTEILVDLIEYMKKKTKLCRHLHIPIQHGHDDMLKAMGRTYTVEHLCKMITRAFDAVPDICIGTDVIVGFPGEKDEHFNDMYNILKALPISYFHVFSFSKRNNAKAKDLPGHIPIEMIQKRSAKLRTLSQRKRRHFHERMINKSFTVLFEQKKYGQWHGLTDNFIQVKISSNKNLKNTLRRVQLLAVEGQTVHGRLTAI